MFTGLIESVGTVGGLRTRDDVLLLEVEAPTLAPELRRGESVAVSGACLTVVEGAPRSFVAEVMPETRRCTRFGRMRPGDRVNLERALSLGGRLDGHVVTGHVDGLVMVKEVRGRGRTRELLLTAEAAILDGLVPKGSVALDGVSLTVAEVGGGFFRVGLIPTTLGDTTLGTIAPGAELHVETDLLGKYVERFLARRLGGEGSSTSAPLTWERLAQYGWTP